MISVAVSGAGGRMGRLVAAAILDEGDLTLSSLYDPEHGGAEVAGNAVTDDAETVGDADVVVEFTRPDVVMENLQRWHRLDTHAVVGTSGFDAARVETLHRIWDSGPPNCLVAPNFSIGAVVMMRLAELAAPHFSAAEVVEMHHDRKADAPSGTAISTAERIGRAGNQQREVESSELVEGSRGGNVGGVPVHAVRLPGLVAHQEVLLGGPGETLTIRHDTTDRSAFLPGILLGVRRVAELPDPVTIGLEVLLGL